MKWFANARILAPRLEKGVPRFVEWGADLGVDGDRVHGFGPGAAERWRSQARPDELRSAQFRDLDGRWVLPTFCDAHLHLHYAAGRRSFLELPPRSSVASLAERVRADRSPDWVLGSGWRDDPLREFGDDPGRALDLLDPVRPVFLWSADHHRALVNRVALERLGLADRHPHGLLLERDAEVAWARIPARPSCLEGAVQDLHRHGITAIGCFDRSDSWSAFDQLDRAGELACRVTHSWPWEDQLDGRPAPTLSRSATSSLRLGWVKVFLDGTLGSRTAWLTSEYSDDPANLGVRRVSQEALEAGVQSIVAAGLALAFHAIGDRAVASAAEAILLARKLRRQHGLPERCDRIEHAELIDDETFARVAKHRVTLSVQPCHLFEDIGVAEARWGDRCRGLLPLKRFADAGVPLVFGTDYPIEALDPWRNLFAARARVDRRGAPRGGFFPDQKLDFDTALAAATVGAVVPQGLPRGWGSLSAGSPADFQILECRDPRAVEDQGAAFLAEVVFAGRSVWRASDAGEGKA